MAYTLYTITNLINNKIYIGISVNYKQRMNTHFGYLNRNEHKNKYLQAEYNKYGKENFVHDIVCIYENKYDASIAERYYTDSIFVLNKSICYNIISGGLEVSDRAREVYLETLINDPMALLKLKERLSKINKGRVWSDEYKENMKQATKGKIVSEETKNKMRKAQLGSKGSGAKPVIDISTGKVYGCLKDAVPDFGFKYCALQSMVNGRNKNKTTLKWLSHITGNN